MRNPVTKMEKVLHQAIRTASGEIFEEMEALEEGANQKESIKSIRSILNDLLNSLENFEEIDIEEEEKMIKESEEEESVSYLFKIGETIRVKGATELPLLSILKKFGYESIDDDRFGDSCREYKGIELGETATILDRNPEEHAGYGNLYLIEYEGEKFFLSETRMEKIGEDYEFEFKIGEKVLLHYEIAFETEYYQEVFGYREVKDFPKYYPPEKSIAKVIDRKIDKQYFHDVCGDPYVVEEEVYVIEIEGKKYFERKGRLSHLK